LKTAARDREAITVIDLVRRLFNLQEKEKEQEQDKKAAASKSGGDPGAQG